MPSKTLLALLAPAACQAMTSFSWGFDNAPEDGASQVTFPMEVGSVAHDQQWYFAAQYGFTKTGMGYTGLQPQEDKDGKSQIRGVFSSFTEGTTTDDENCSDGADGGPGVSCGFVFDHDYSQILNLVVENAGGDKWQGKAVNVETGAEASLGSWTLPSGSGNINLGGQAGFVERYLNNDPNKCNEIPRVEVNFYNPKTNVDAGTSSISGMKEYDFCKGEKNWSATEFDGGYNVAMGFE